MLSLTKRLIITFWLLALRKLGNKFSFSFEICHWKKKNVYLLGILPRYVALDVLQQDTNGITVSKPEGLRSQTRMGLPPCQLSFNSIIINI